MRSSKREPSEDAPKDVVQEVHLAIDNRDLESLASAMSQCRAEGVPTHYLEKGASFKQELEKLLARIQDAIHSQDVAAISSCVLDCQQADIPARYLESAIEQQKELQLLVDNLARACQARDLGAVQQAMQDCDGLRGWMKFRLQ